jgi:hypothetical protein
MEHIADVFMSIGYGVAEGPNSNPSGSTSTPSTYRRDHPARTMQDTFFVASAESGVVLRTQTSPMQIRTMLDQRPAGLRRVPGRVYRTDELDATHTPVFHQVEGLAVDKGLSMVDLKSTLDWFAARCSATASTPGLRPSTSRSPSRAPRSTSSASSAVAPPSGTRTGRAAPVQQRGLDRVGRMRHGEPARPHGGAESTRRSPRIRLRHGHRAHVDVPPRMSDMRDIVEGDIRFTTGVRNGQLMRAPLSWMRESSPSLQANRAATWQHDSSVGLEVETVETEVPIDGPLAGRPGARDRGTHRVQEADPLLPGRCRAHGGCAGSSAGPRNFAAGDLVVVALPGTVLPGGFRDRIAQDLWAGLATA